ncbi:MAG TPA: hypothetical protein VNT60_08555, partial [Deinococcales bacterium]|nr:hypothetical protein [Deinococcales bacterium]
MSGRRAATDPATRARALQVAEEHGAAEASRQTGVPAGTIRAWRSRSGEAGPPSGVDVERWQTAKEAGAREAWSTAQAALSKVTALLDAGKTLDAQRAALTAAILIDKSGGLERAAAEAQARDVRLSELQAERIASAILGTLEDLGIPAGAPVRRVLRARLDGTPDGEAAERARRDVRDHFEGPLREELARVEVPPEEPERREPLALPPGPPPHPDGPEAEAAEQAAPEPMFPIVRVGRPARPVSANGPLWTPHRSFR